MDYIEQLNAAEERCAEAQRAVLKLLLSDGVDIESLIRLVDSAEFNYRPKRIYRLAIELHHAGVKPTPESVRVELSGSRDFPSYDHELLEVEGTHVELDYANHYVETLSDAWYRLHVLKRIISVNEGLTVGVDRQHLGRLVGEIALPKDDGSHGWNPSIMDSAQFAKAEFPKNYLVDKVLIEGQFGVIGGPEKSLKTSIAVDLAVSLGTGTPFLSNPDFAVPNRVDVMVISGESGGAKLKETAQHVCEARGRLLSNAGIHWATELPNLTSPRDLSGLERQIDARGVRVCILDPAYLCLPGVEMSKVNDVGSVLKLVADVGRRTNCTILLVPHAVKPDRKNRFIPTELSDLSGAGWREFARQWLLLTRRREYDHDGVHDLYLTFGGSAGHSGSRVVLVF